MKSLYTLNDLKKKKTLKAFKDLFKEDEVYFVDDVTDFSFDIKQYNNVEEQCLDDVVDFEKKEMKITHPDKLIISEVLDRKKNLVLYTMADQAEVDKKIEELLDKKIYIDRYLPDTYMVAKYIAETYSNMTGIFYFETHKHKYTVISYAGVPYFIEKEKQPSIAEKLEYVRNYNEEEAIAKKEERKNSYKKIDILKPVFENPDFTEVSIWSVDSNVDAKKRQGFTKIVSEWVWRNVQYHTF